MQAITVVRILLSLAMLVLVAWVFYRERSRLVSFPTSIWRRFTFGVMLESTLVLSVTMFGAVLCSFVPVLRTGALHFIFQEGGNIFVSSVNKTAQEAPWLIVRLSGPLFFLVLLYIVPFWAEAEEHIFRKGHIAWKPIMKKSVIFGLLHLLAGVPLGICLLLIGVGFYYACKYRDAYVVSRQQGMCHEHAVQVGLLESTTYHAAYNSIAVIICFICGCIMALHGPTP